MKAERRWLILIGLFVLSLPAVTTRLYSSDEIQYFSYLRSLWFDRDVSFENEYRYFYDRGVAANDGFRETFLERQTETGRRISFATIGCAILWAPFYAAGDAAARITGAPVDGYSKPYVAAVAYGSAVYGFLGLTIAILAARRMQLDAFGAALAVWLGTPLLFYMYVAPVFSHACSAFAVASFIYVWLRVRGSWTPRGAAALAASGALMAMVREQDAFLILGPAVDFALRILRTRDDSRMDAHRARSIAQVVATAAAVFALVYLPQALAYRALNGHIGPHSSVGRKMNWMSPHALQVLFSPEHGFFVWTPLALIALAGIVTLLADRRSDRPIRQRPLAVSLLVMALLQVYVSGSVESWTVAGGFGQRRFIALTAVLVIGYAAAGAALRARSRQGGRVLAAVTILAVYWNLALSAEFATGLMDRQKLEPRKNAYDALVTLPAQAPSIVYRYLFDRESFYRSRGTP
ncbi:MAG TPA: hypothetical protein VFK57_20815 [Vicinamibacterales bacterium]|nr:hypothetical protein [Vicinamibacterales bacterium]